jgi:hypothetical protein
MRQWDVFKFANKPNPTRGVSVVIGDEPTYGFIQVYDLEKRAPYKLNTNGSVQQNVFELVDG